MNDQCKWSTNRSNAQKIFKDIGFAIDNLNKGTYRPYKKPSDLLSYINKSSSHPPQIINQLITKDNQ